MQKNQFLLLKKLKNTGSAQLCAEIAYFYSEIGLEVSFGTTLQNRNPQMPSFVSMSPVMHSASQVLHICDQMLAVLFTKETPAGNHTLLPTF